jgi:hypothetical protein
MAKRLSKKEREARERHEKEVMGEFLRAIYTGKTLHIYTETLPLGTTDFGSNKYKTIFYSDDFIQPIVTIYVPVTHAFRYDTIVEPKEALDLFKKFKNTAIYPKVY